MPDLRKRMLGSARARATRRGIPCTIEVDDIVIPRRCPLLGIPLRQSLGKQGPGDNSPTLDRVNPDKGYVPGNVLVISNRANRIKNDASPQDLRKLAEALWPHFLKSQGA